MKKALANSAGPLAVIVSDSFNTEVISQHAAHAPEESRKVRVKVKETAADGWIRLPGHQFEPVPRWREVLDSLVGWLRRITRAA